MSGLHAIYAAATDAQRERGRAWYRDMLAECRAISRDTGVPLRRVVATVAITSPDARLSSNLAWARVACETRGDAAVGRYPNTMRQRYAPILRGEVDPLAGVGGPKVTAFYRAILGDEDAVVLDRWALRAVGHHRDSCTAKQYAEYAARFRRAAASEGESPAHFQAITWVVLRDGAVRSDGRRQGLTDLREAA